MLYFTKYFSWPDWLYFYSFFSFENFDSFDQYAAYYVPLITGRRGVYKTAGGFGGGGLESSFTSTKMG